MSTDSPTPFDFARVLWFAERSNAVYLSREEILTQFPDTLHVARFEDTDVQYFLERDEEQSIQTITVRGTDNWANVLLDLEYVPVKNSELDIWVHRGFNAAAHQVFEDVMPLIDTQQPVQFTGHSMGAAVATLLMMYFHNHGVEIRDSVNFGQPKVTTRAGAKAYADLPLTRVIDERDPVPMVPPVDLLDSRHGEYSHLGTELLLLDGQHYSSMDGHDSLRAEVAGFWHRLFHERPNDHLMDNYVSRIREKLTGAAWVPWRKRESFE